MRRFRNLGTVAGSNLPGATMGKQPTLTTDEALAECDKLIEENIRMLKALKLRIYQKGIAYHQESLKLAQSKTDLLRNIRYYGAYLSGAVAMLLRLRDARLTLEEHITGGNHKTRDKLKLTSEMKVCNKAVIDLLLKDKLNIERFLEGGYIINFVDPEKDKKGKLLKCRACFTKKVVKYEEI